MFFVDDLDDLLSGREAFEHLAADGAVGDGLDEVLDHHEVDVRFQQGELDLAHGFLHVGFVELAARIQPFKHRLQFFRDAFKRHLLPPKPARGFAGAGLFVLR